MSFDRLAAELTRTAERLAETRARRRLHRAFWHRPRLLWPLFTKEDR